jgi:hypothetical protein
MSVMSCLILLPLVLRAGGWGNPLDLMHHNMWLAVFYGVMICVRNILVGVNTLVHTYRDWGNPLYLSSISGDQQCWGNVRFSSALFEVNIHQCSHVWTLEAHYTSITTLCVKSWSCWTRYESVMFCLKLVTWHSDVGTYGVSYTSITMTFSMMSGGVDLSENAPHLLHRNLTRVYVHSHSSQIRAWTAFKTPFPTVPLLLHAYPLLQEHVYQVIAQQKLSPLPSFRADNQERLYRNLIFRWLDTWHKIIRHDITPEGWTEYLVL